MSETKTAPVANLAASTASAPAQASTTAPATTAPSAVAQAQATAAARPNSGLVKARAGLPEVKVLTKIEAKGPDSFLTLITNMTGDADFAEKFVACTKMQIRQAWHNVGGKWENDFNCVPMDSVLECLYDCATRRILPDGYNGYLVVYKGKNPRCQFLPDYKGMIAAAVAERVILDCNAKEVRENDDITIEWGEVTHFGIDPKRPRGEIIGCAAYAVLPNGMRRSVYLDIDELKAIRDCAQTDNIYRDWEAEMYKKSAIRRLLKTMPVTSSRLIGLFEMDNRTFDLNRREQARAPMVTTSRVKSLAGPSEPQAEPVDVVPQAEPEPVF